MKHSCLNPWRVHALSSQRVPTINEHSFDCIDRISLVAHQMLTPLAIIDGSAQRLIRSNSRANIDVTECGMRIRAAAQELANLAHSLLDQVRASMELSTQNWVRYSLSEVLHGAANRIRSLQPTRPVLVDASQVPEQLHGRPELLGQMIAILLDNAAKYSEPDRPIEMRAYWSSENVVLDVSDEGMGIHDAEIEKIFQPFYRAGNTAPRDGIGLGLSLARKIARYHGGEISARSKVGIGSTFSIRLPQTSMSSAAAQYCSIAD